MQHPVQKRHLVIIGGILALLFLAYIRFAPLPVYRTSDQFGSIIVQDSVDLGPGRRLARSICVQCHMNYGTGTLSGRLHGNPKRVGDFWSSNITRDTLTGIGGWTTEELYYFFRTGIKRNGHYAYDMPKYPNLSEQDLNSLIRFLQSNDPLVRATYQVQPPPRYSFASRLLLHLWFRPVPFNSAHIAHPDTTDQLEYGHYLATAKYSCFDCHSRNSVTNNYASPERSWKFFQGGNRHANEDRAIIYSSNLTPDDKSGIGLWTEQEFYNTLRYGIKPDGKAVQDPMFPFPLLDDREISAIFRYLRSLPPVSNNY